MRSMHAKCNVLLCHSGEGLGSIRERCARQGVGHEGLFPFLLLNSEMIVLQSQHHSLKPAWSSTQRFLENGLQRLLIRVDRYVMLSIWVMMPFLHTGHNRQALFLNLSIVIFCSTKGV